MRPTACTAVASVNTSPAPPTALLPKCTKCHGPGCPSLAEYSHIGETPIRFFSSSSRIRHGAKSMNSSAPSSSKNTLDSSRLVAGTKYRGAHANLCGAFPNRRLKVVRHPHGKHRQHNSQPRLQRLLAFSELCEKRPGVVRTFKKR